MPTEDELLTQYQAAKQAGDTAAMQAVSQQFVDLYGSDEPSASTFIPGMARSLAQGVTFGFADEIEAFARSLVDQSKPYKQIREEIRGGLEEFQGSHPWFAGLAEFAGGAAVPFGVMGAVGKAVPRLAQLVQKGAESHRLAQLAGAGAAEGALAGLGTAKEGESLLGEAAIGAASGAAFGGLGRGLESLLASRAKPPVLSQLERATGGHPLEMFADRMRELGPQATLADVSPSMRKLAGTAAHSDLGSLADAYEQFLQKRTQGMSGRVEEIVSDASGVPQGTTRIGAKEALSRLRSREADVLYGRVRQQAAAAPVSLSDAQKAMIRTDPIGKRVARNSLLSMQRESGNYGLTLEQVEGSFDFWHRVQSELRETAEKMGTPTQPGSSRLAGGDVGRLRQSLMNEMQDSRRNPWGDKYREATESFRQRSEVLDSLEDSTKFSRMATEDLRTLVGDMSVDEKGAFTTGIVADLIQRSRMSPETANSARNIIKSAQTRDNFKVLLGAPAADELVKKLRNESLLLQTETHILGGSQTAPRLQAGAAVTEPGAEDLAFDLLSGEPFSFAQKILQGLSGARGADIISDPNVRGKVLETMMIQDPDELARRFMELEQTRSLAGTTAGWIPGLISGAAISSQ